MAAIPIGRSPVGPNVNVQGAKGKDNCSGQVSQRLWDVLKLGDLDGAVLAALASSWRDLRLGHPLAVDGLQAPRLQRPAPLANAPGAKLGPQLHKLARVREDRRWQAHVVVGDVLCQGRFDVVVLEELLLDATAVGLDLALVLLELLRGESSPGALALRQRR